MPATLKSAHHVNEKGLNFEYFLYGFVFSDTKRSSHVFFIELVFVLFLSIKLSDEIAKHLNIC